MSQDPYKIAHQIEADDEEILNTKKIGKNWSLLAQIGQNWPKVAKNGQNSILKDSY